MKTYNRKMKKKISSSHLDSDVTNDVNNDVANPGRSILATLGGMSVDEFMSVYWHRKPLLIRQAMPNFRSPISPDEVLDVAFTDEAQARLIRKSIKPSGDSWRLDRAPLDFIPSLKTKNWTVLLQGADTEWDSIAKLLGQFRFIADARLDDLMISVASDGGGVGPHIDSYDVFLLQAHGRRHWRWGKPKNAQATLVPDQPLKILQNFTPTSEATLAPGDLLYLPPGFAHDGVAQGVCMTFSIGFRSASRKELTSDFLGRIASDAVLGNLATQRLKDDCRKAASNPAKLPDTLREGYSEWLKAWRPSQEQIDQFLGEHLSEPRASVVFDPPKRGGQLGRSALTKFKDGALKNGLRLHRSSRALFDKTSLFINGEAYQSRSKPLRQFFNQRYLSSADFNDVVAKASATSASTTSESTNNRLTSADWDLLLSWHGNGWLNIGV